MRAFNISERLSLKNRDHSIGKVPNAFKICTYHEKVDEGGWENFWKGQSCSQIYLVDLYTLRFIE